jgi:hypothetical protein
MTDLNLIFDTNVLTMIFERLIKNAKDQKGCEYAYQCIKNCFNVCSKWKKIIKNHLMQHCQFTTHLNPLNSRTTKLYYCSDIKLKNIYFGNKYIEYSFGMTLNFDFVMSARNPKIHPSFPLICTPKCSDFCPWCCILHFDYTKNKHGKRSIYC